MKCGKWRQIRKQRWPEWRRSCRGPHGWVSLSASKESTAMYGYSASVSTPEHILFDERFVSMAEAKQAADMAYREHYGPWPRTTVPTLVLPRRRRR